MNKQLAIAFLVVIIALLVAVGFFALQREELTSQLFQNSTQTTPTPPRAQQPAATQEAETISSVQDLQELIEENVNSGDFSNLEPYMASNVVVTIMSTDCCGEKTPQEAALQIDYIATGLPLDFDQETELVANLKDNNERLENAFIGISESESQLLAITLNDNNEIEAVEVSISWELYSQ